MIKYYKPKFNFPGFSTNRIYSSENLKQSFYIEYNHLFERLHSLKRFKILMALVGLEQTVIAELATEDYVDFFNKNREVKPIEILDTFRNKVYKIGDKITYKSNNSFDVGEIIGFNFGAKLEIITTTKTIEDMDIILGINSEYVTYYFGSESVKCGDKVYVWNGETTDLIKFRDGIKGSKYFRNSIELIAYYIEEELSLSYTEFVFGIGLKTDIDIQKYICGRATLVLFGQELVLNDDKLKELTTTYFKYYGKSII